MLKGNSLKRRAGLFVACVVLLFLSIAGTTLYKAFGDSFRRNAESAMQAQIVSLLSTLDFDQKGNIYFDALPFPELSIPNSGEYAEIWRQQELLWRSDSLIGRALPKVEAEAESFQFYDKHESEKKYLLSTVVDWEQSEIDLLELRFVSAVDSTPYKQQIGRYGRSILLWLAVLGGLLILLQTFLFAWLFRPLSKVVDELQEIEKGERDQFDDDYPNEIRGLTESLNQYVQHEKRQITKQKETLANLAHSLKTPVAVIKNTLQDQSGGDKGGDKVSGDQSIDKQLIDQQLDRINDSIDYQLNRANLAARKRYQSGQRVDKEVIRVVEAIRKLAQLSGNELDAQIDEGIEFYGEVGDLLEIVGNLLENANKWAESKIVLTLNPVANSRRVQLTVMDDGPGIPSNEVASITQRGKRLDEKAKGYGIGLSVVADIVESYNGRLNFQESKDKKIGLSFTSGLCVEVEI